MGPTHPLNSDNPNGDHHEEFRRSGEGNGPPPLIIDILDSSESDDDDIAAVNNLAGYIEAVPTAFNGPVSNNIGYELLSQDPEYFADVGVVSYEEDEEIIHEGAVSVVEVNDTSQSECSSETSRLNTSEASDKSSDNISRNSNVIKETMDPEHIEKIMNVMKSIKIPASNLPEWSQFVPEDKWKCVLLEKLHVMPNSSDCAVAQTLVQPSSSSSGTNSLGFLPGVQFTNFSKDSPNSPESQVTDASSSNSPSLKNNSNAPSMEELSHSPLSNHCEESVGD